MPRELAGDFDYDRAQVEYARHRRADPRIAAQVRAALGEARTVVNVGAGGGSYEPTDLDVTPVEPSASQRAQRPAHHAAAVDGIAEELPFPDDAFDAAMATITVHHWKDTDAGLREMLRVSRGPVVVLTFDPTQLMRLWLDAYAPELFEAEARRYPSIAHLVEVLGSDGRDVEVQDVPIALDCTDGVTEAFYGRPEEMLRPEVRKAQSAWGFVADGVEERFERTLRADLESGEWDRRYGHLRTQPTFVGAMKLVVGRRPTVSTVARA